MSYQVTAVRDATGLELLEQPWLRLLEQSSAASIFVSLPWNLAWWHAYGADKHLFVLVAADEQGVVRGIAPLMINRSGAPRKLEFIGTGLSDTGDFVLDPLYAEPAAAAMFAYLQLHCREWDLLDLDEVPPYSFLAAWLAEHKPATMQVIKLPRTDAPFIALPATWEDYTRGLQRKPRQQLVAFSNRVAEEIDATFRLNSSVAEAGPAVERFYQLHLARWGNKEGELNPEHLEPRFLLFLKEVAQRSAQHGLLRVAELFAGDTPIASWISFNVSGRWNGYMTGFDPAWNNKRPGKLLHGFVMRAALAEQAHELDFGRGAEEYKYELGATNRTNSRFVVASNAPRSSLAFGLTTLGRRGRDLVKSIRPS